jgi:hypothetical protein
MKTKRFIIATTLCLLCTLYAKAYDFMADGMCYKVIAGTDNVEVTSPDAPVTYKGAISIPATVSREGKAYLVTSIGDRAFSNNKTITSITLPERLQTIGRYAFHGTGIESIVLPNTLTRIGYASFEGSYIKSITIPASVGYIDDWAFTKCPYLASIVFEGPVSYLGYYIFAGYAGSSRSYTIEVKCEPFNIDRSLWYVNVEKSTLIVPDGMKGLFLASPGWRDFGTILEKSVVSNEAPVTKISPNVYISGNRLYIETSCNETVQIYSITGLLVSRFTKPAGNVSYPVSSFNGRLLIVRGSSGWVKKVMQTKRH